MSVYLLSNLRDEAEAVEVSELCFLTKGQTAELEKEISQADICKENDILL